MKIKQFKQLKNFEESYSTLTENLKLDTVFGPYWRLIELIKIESTIFCLIFFRDYPGIQTLILYF